MKRAFVTGGSGFVGRNLLLELIRRNVEVRALARSPAAARKVRQLGAEPVKGDLGSVEAMATAMSGADVVFHAGALVKSWGSPDEFQRVNVDGTSHVIRAARSAGVPRLVHVSTEAVLAGGPPIRDADETWPYPKNPAGLYPSSKGLAERFVLEASDSVLTTVAVRPPFVWGHGDTSVLPQIVAAVRRRQWMWFDGGHYPHATTHVRNVVEGLLLAAENGRGGQAYFVSDGPERDFRDFLTVLLETQGVEPGNRKVPTWLARIIAPSSEAIWRAFKLGGEPLLVESVIYLIGQELTVNTSKAREELGYRPVVSFEQGVAEMRARPDGFPAHGPRKIDTSRAPHA